MTFDSKIYIEDNNFTQVLRSPAVSSDQFKTSICREVFNWWHSFMPNIPTRAQFDILDHINKAPNIFLIAVLQDHQFEYRLHGEEVVELVGRSSAGVTFSVDSEDLDLSRFAKYLDDFSEKKTAIHSYGKLTAHGKSYSSFEAFDFPLIDDIGNVSHIVGVITAITDKEFKSIWKNKL